MHKIKSKYKHLATVIISVVVLFTLNVQTFAVAPYSFTVKPFEKGKFLIYRSYHYGNTNVDTEDITDNYTDYLTIGHDEKQSYIYPSNSRPNDHYYYSVISLMPVNFLNGEQYNFSFKCVFQYNGGGGDYGNKLYMALIVVDMSTNEIVNTIDLYDNRNIGYRNTVNGTFTFQSGTSNSYGVALLTQPCLGASYSAVVHNYFTITHPYFEIVNPLYGDHFDPPPNPLDDLNKGFDDIINELPRLDEDEVGDLLNFDFSSYTDGLMFIKNTFERITDTLEIESVLLFCLSFGLAAYILGKKVA